MISQSLLSAALWPHLTVYLCKAHNTYVSTTACFDMINWKEQIGLFAVIKMASEAIEVIVSIAIEQEI